jgi:hypothetical protein
MFRSRVARFAALVVTAILALSFALPLADAQPRRRGAPAPTPIDLNTPEGAMAASRKLWCSLTDGEVVTWYWNGAVYSRRAGEADRKLFDVEGMNIRTCGTVTDETRGAGYRTVSREILLYKDPATGRVLNMWTNPWTNESVQVLHVANDPVNATSYIRGRDGTPTRWTGQQLGGQWWITNTFPLFYSNPLAGAYQDEVGGKYHATEMFNFMGDVADLVDPTRNSAQVRVAWVRISDWLPWMKMGDREGSLYFNTSGRKLANFTDMPQTFRDEITRYYPEYVAPPPLSDTRQNETSWTYYQAVREGRRTPPVRQ